MSKKTFIISLGGSLIVPPAGIDWQYLKRFRKLIIQEIKNGSRFVIVTGGGDVARVYQRAATRIVRLTHDDQDWLGIHATRMNAHLIKTVFRTYAHPRINKNPRTKADLWKHFKKGESVMVAAGWRPGWSTDYIATILAERLKSKVVINLSNIDYAYDKDPKKYPNAKILKSIDWQSFRKIVGHKWDPGLNMPFDPVASALAEKLKLEVAIMNGHNLINLKNYLSGKKFRGTVIS